VQVVNTAVKSLDLAQLAEKLKKVGAVSFNEFMLSFTTGDHEIIVFPDGRAIIKNTLDQALAKELYARYISPLNP